MADRILLSPPDVGARERELLLEAFDSNWIAPLGPQVDAFEAEFAAHVGGGRSACALASGTAALHLALLLHDIGPGDEVLTASFTFCATANAITYTGARPVLVDSHWRSWNIDPELVAAELHRRAAAGTLPKAVVSVDLFGQCADYDALTAACAPYDVPVIADAAEALGATYLGEPAGRQTDLAVFSFNGNKILTTSGGGMLTGPAELMDRARYLAAQARRPALHYEHTEIGFNYRMSNLLAAVGRGQLEGLAHKVALRQAINKRYRDGLRNLPVSFMPRAAYGTPTNWLTVMLLDPDLPITPHQVCEALAGADIEARPAWKPLHLQPLYRGNECVGGAVAEEIYRRAVCLPSGSSLTEAQQERVISALTAAVEHLS
jgi:dTDP-4-amino-4,6-dideoxygalactose transaminase